MKILITGGSGLVGSSLTKVLLGMNYDVAILTRNPSSDIDVKQYLSCWKCLKTFLNYISYFDLHQCLGFKDLKIVIFEIIFVVHLLYTPLQFHLSKKVFSYINFPTPGQMSKKVLSDCGGG